MVKLPSWADFCPGQIVAPSPGRPGWRCQDSNGNIYQINMWEIEVQIGDQVWKFQAGRWIPPKQ